MKKIMTGVWNNLLKLGSGANEVAVKAVSGALEVRNPGDTAYAAAKGAGVIWSATSLDHLASMLDVNAAIVDIQFSFDGASPPAAAGVSGQFGLCHTTGGAYTAGLIYYSDGTSLIAVPAALAKTLTTRTAITGTISMNANGLYKLEAGSWVLKGDGTVADTGHNKTIKVAYAFGNLTPSSTASIPAGATIRRVSNIVSTIFSGGVGDGTILVEVNSEAVLATTESSLYIAQEVQKDDSFITSAGGTVDITVTMDSETAGAGYILVDYVAPLS